MRLPPRISLSLASLCLLATTTVAIGQDFYKQPPLFSTAPSPEKSIQTITRFGPVGMGIDLVQPAFTMQIHNIEEGSPAAATGKLKAKQFIRSINGQTLKDIDPRIQLGNLLAEAEATNGLLKFMVSTKAEGPAEEVDVKIPVLGRYSETWPLECPKSERIVRGFADYLAQPDSHKGFSGIGMLFLLSTGEEQDLEPVREWARGLAAKTPPTYAWHLGYGGIPLTEYYLRTGDETVLPTIQSWVDSAVAGQYLDGWAGRGGVAHVTYGGGGGHLNAGGTAVVTFLLLAKQCGANVPDHALHGALAHFYRFAGRGNNPYGDNEPEKGFVDNGKNGNLAFAMAAAAALTPGGESSVYAGARDAAAMTSFYTTTFMLHGHTGGGIGEIWRSAAMGLLHKTRPKQYREFMDHRRWHYDLSRRFDGSFAIVGGAGYDKIEWGAGYALGYTIPRQTLQITGAPKSRFSKDYQLPERPWGAMADDAFASIEPAALNDGTRPDFTGEELATDSGRPLLLKLISAKVDEQTLRRYACHPDYVIRRIAVNKVMGLNTAYLGGAGGGGGIHTELAHELLASKDARIRRAVLEAIAARLAGDALMEFLSPQGYDSVLAMLRDPNESWWVKDAALHVISRVPSERIVEQVDLILPYLKHEEWWLQHAALSALGPVVADERCYRKVLPAIGEFLRTCQRWNTTQPVRWGPLPDNLRKASPEVRKLAAKELKEAFTGFTGTTTAPGGQDITKTYDAQLEFLATSLADVPGGYDMLYEIARQRFPNDPLPYDTIFLRADPEKFGPDLRKAIVPIIRDQLIYEYIGKNQRSLLPEVEATRQSPFVTGSLDGLVALYRKLGVDEYEWKPFGPDLYNAQWDYFTFDPPEKQKHDISPWRYRAVTYPSGMEEWFAPSFDPRKAGWQRGQAPFGQYKGELVTNSRPCSNPDCRHAHPMRTLWDKEVLLVRGTFQFPPLREGYRYRIRVGTGQHVGSGDGYKIYLNGKPLIEVESGVGRRQGAKPRGAFITQEFFDDFNKGPVTIAATSFLRYGSRAIVTTPPVPQGIFSLWVEEMKLPPVNDQAIRKSATVIPMLSHDWQQAQHPDNQEQQLEDSKFRYDGEFDPNPHVIGDWQAIDVVATIDDFSPEQKMDPRRATFKQLTLSENGSTNVGTVIWSGDLLMDLQRYEALRMRTKTIGKAQYLFVETGGFSERQPAGWESSWSVMKKSAD